MIGFHYFDIIVLLTFWVVPWLIAFLWMRPDANRRGQPGWLWALLALPFSWLIIFVYLIVRAISDGMRAA
jgi:hypothetical protein